MNNLLEGNLDNVKEEIDLFGNVEKKLSMRDRIGFLPISIWETDWTKVKQLKGIIGDSGETRELVGQKMTLMGSKYSTSIFNPHLAQMILSAYCPTDATIYDPFAGGGTRGFIASAMGHKYWGREIRKEEVDRILAQQKILDQKFIINVGDAQEAPPMKDYYNFSYTCPPYYNLEVYSKQENDLSAAKTYENFLAMLLRCMKSVYDSLKSGSLSVWVVGNFRDKEGYLVHFNGDLIKLSRHIGFKLHDELVFWGASKCAAQRCGQFEANRKSVRVHEYIVILRK